MANMDGLMEWQSATPMPNLAKRQKDPEWERKQRAREYRVAARREKRNRKADEKKQRKLNATILRRMTRNPEKYTRNLERNRGREIDLERQALQSAALKQIQKLAIIHDPSGKTFNIGPVTTQPDGTVVSVEELRRREERKAIVDAIQRGEQPQQPLLDDYGRPLPPARSKTQAKKLAKFAPRPPVSKPVLPEGILLPEGEENWLELWDLPEDELEHRVARNRRQKQQARKDLRNKQQEGKVERRAARDEKRRVYRALKMTWRKIKEQEDKFKTRLKSIEEEESKKLAVEVATSNRQTAMTICADLGFTIQNTPEVDNVKPKLVGMKGQEVDFDEFELDELTKEVKLKAPTTAYNNPKRVDLSKAATKGSYVASGDQRNNEDPGDFVKLEVGADLQHEALSFNHKLRRKLKRAFERADVERELLVRARAIQYLEDRGETVPPELQTGGLPRHVRGQRLLENGLLETEKQVRSQKRLALAEFNEAARVLRKQAKERSLEAGLRIHAEMTGKITPRESREEDWGPGWYVSKAPEVEDAIKPEDLMVQ